MKKAIRLEAIGGQGAHSAGKIVAEAAVLGMGYAGNHFSSFGSEKRGSPVRSSVRYRDDGHPVRSAAPITRPDLLVIFHEALLDHSATACEGAHPELAVLVNSSMAPEALPFPADFHARTLAVIDAAAIARAHQSGLNAVMLGAMLRFCPELARETLVSAFSRFFQRLSPEALERNLRALDAGFRAVRPRTFFPHRTALPASGARLPQLGYENAPLGGVITNPGNTILRDMSHSRKGTIPQLDYERCIQCGYCDMVCPDYCFVWKRTPVSTARVTLPSGESAWRESILSVPFLQGIDYRYCKGCQKCVEACPVSALRLVADTPGNREYSHAPRFHARTTEQATPIFQENEDENES